MMEWRNIFLLKDNQDSNPVRQIMKSELRDEALEFQAETRFPVVLILGGSLGAGSINKCLTDNIGMMVDSVVSGSGRQASITTTIS
jgi:UDP-N-acetylglucosamine:LPS N-acetylglucosamine transferase